jgi:hypothetical protein
MIDKMKMKKKSPNDRMNILGVRYKIEDFHESLQNNADVCVSPADSPI